MLRIIGLLLVLLPLVCQAEIFRHKDSQGNIIFSDKPSPAAKKVKLAPTQLYSPAPIPKQPPEELQDTPKPPPVQPYSRPTIKIINIRDDDPIRSNNGDLKIQTEIIPPLPAAQGESLSYLIDGRPLPVKIFLEGTPPPRRTEIIIPNVSRGTHTLEVQLIGPGGEIIRQSKQVTFHLLRVHINRPKQIRKLKTLTAPVGQGMQTLLPPMKTLQKPQK